MNVNPSPDPDGFPLLNFAANDVTSGIDYYEMTVADNEPLRVTPDEAALGYLLRDLEDGTYTVSVVAVDMAGNSRESSAAVLITAGWTKPLEVEEEWSIWNYLADLNEGSKLAWLFFPGKIKFDMLLENTGNVEIAPSKVEFKIYDRTGEAQLEEVTNIGSIDTIAPYDTDTVTAELPTRLPAGSYIARYRIYNGEDLKQEGDLSLNILPEGTAQSAGFGFIGLSIAHKISLLLPIFALLIAVLYFLFMRQKGRKR